MVIFCCLNFLLVSATIFSVSLLCLFSFSFLLLLNNLFVLGIESGLLIFLLTLFLLCGSLFFWFQQPKAQGEKSQRKSQGGCFVIFTSSKFDGETSRSHQN